MRVSWKRLQHGWNDGGRDDEEKINWGCFGFSFFFVLGSWVVNSQSCWLVVGTLQGGRMEKERYPLTFLYKTGLHAHIISQTRHGFV